MNCFNCLKAHEPVTTDPSSPEDIKQCQKDMIQHYSASLSNFIFYTYIEKARNEWKIQKLYTPTILTDGNMSSKEYQQYSMLFQKVIK